MMHVEYKAGKNTHMQLVFPAHVIHVMPYLVWLHTKVTCLVLHTLLTLMRTLDWVKSLEIDTLHLSILWPG